MRKHRFKRKRDSETCCDCDNGCGCGKLNGAGACGGGIYFLGFIGAAVYYLQQSATFGQGVVGILKAFIWPVFLIYKLLGGI